MWKKLFMLKSRKSNNLHMLKKNKKSNNRGIFCLKNIFYFFYFLVPKNQQHQYNIRKKYL